MERMILDYQVLHARLDKVEQELQELKKSPKHEH
jgi:hypothetical protein